MSLAALEGLSPSRRAAVVGRAYRRLAGLGADVSRLSKAQLDWIYKEHGWTASKMRDPKFTQTEVDAMAKQAAAALPTAAPPAAARPAAAAPEAEVEAGLPGWLIPLGILGAAGLVTVMVLTLR